METLNYKNIYVDGDIRFRGEINFNRLEEESYRVPAVLKGHGYKWPGDYEGRSMLGVVLLSRSVHREPKYLQDFIKLLPEILNEKGYFGPVLPEGTFNEQQLSANSWALRGFVEYYLWKKDPYILSIIEKYVDNLLLPLKGHIGGYPSKPEQRVFEGEMVGNIAAKCGNWYLSTDIGCAFIMLDGATHAYSVVRREELAQLIDEMIEKFLSIDFVELSCQTHATLSGLRGILRYYEICKKPELLQEVESVYKLYINEALTENYANYNWFGRPTWTEPCAVVDSFTVAVELWKHTNNESYLNDAHNIWFNAIGHGQRPNGGFGTDMCAGNESIYLGKGTNQFEAVQCCSMRGGEGLEKAVRYLYFTDKDRVILPFYNDNTVKIQTEVGDILIKQTARYPYEGDIKLEVVNSTVNSSITLELFIPQWVDNKGIKLEINNEATEYIIENGFIKLTYEPRTGDMLQLNFDIQLRAENTINKHSVKGYNTFRHGTLILGLDNYERELTAEDISEATHIGNGKYKVENTDIVLIPVNNMINIPFEKAVSNKKQILFRK
jgi:uncharacterized protein